MENKTIRQPLYPLLAVGSLYAAFAVLALMNPLTAELQRTLVLVELALPLLLFIPDAKNRLTLGHSLLWYAVTWGAVSVAALTLQFLSGTEVFWQSRFLSLSTWFCISGGLALASRFRGEWPSRVRIILLMLFTLPLLWQYLSLEYAGKTVGNLQAVSPLWAWRSGGSGGVLLLVVGGVGWLAALGWFPKPSTKVTATTLLLMFLAPLSAQDSIELLSPRFGRPGTWAPARVTIAEAAGGSDAVVIRSHAPGTVLELDTGAMQGTEGTTAVIPVFLGNGAYLSANSGRLDLEIPAPRRPVAVDYRLPYVAVFAPESVNPRAYYPTAPSARFCDYYSDAEFFSDWRYLDGYDAVVLFHPQEANLPVEASKVLAQFASLGGSVIVVGSFQFESHAEGLSAPSEPEALQFRNLLARRFGYGAGAIYRLSWPDIRDSSYPAGILDQLIQNQRWFGAKRPPARKPDCRALPVPPLNIPNAGGFSNTPSFGAYALMGGLIVILFVIPIAGGRAKSRRWLVPGLIVVGISGIGLASTSIERPNPTAESATILFSDGGPNSPASARIWLQVELPTTLTFRLNALDEQGLARPFHSGDWSGLQVDMPLIKGVEAGGYSVHMRGGRVNGKVFRSVITKARKGETPFSENEARILEWWLQHNAWRGRSATIAQGKYIVPPLLLENYRIRNRGVLLVSGIRQ